MSAYQEHLDPSCPEAMSTDGKAKSNTLRVLRKVVHSELYHGQFMPLLDEIDRLHAENAALTAAVERVRALHVRVKGKYFPAFCEHCDSRSYPCDTIAALEETP